MVFEKKKSKLGAASYRVMGKNEVVYFFRNHACLICKKSSFHTARQKFGLPTRVVGIENKKILFKTRNCIQHRPETVYIQYQRCSCDCVIVCQDCLSQSLNGERLV